MQTATSVELLGPWNESALRKLAEWDPGWAKACAKVSTNPWTNGVLSRKLTELICIALNAACTNLNVEGTRRHIRAALEAGATRDEILFVLKCATVMAIHSCSLGAPILYKEAPRTAFEAMCDETTKHVKEGVRTPTVDKMKAIGQWNDAWDSFLVLDPLWTDEFMATGIGIYTSGVLPAKDVELLSVALDASFTHMYAPGTQRHIKNAMRAGATIREVMDVLKLCVAQGVAACNLAVPILAEELAKQGK